MNKISVGLSAILLFAFGAGAQQAAAPSENSITDAARKLETQMAKNVPTGAEEMPAEKYDFRPTPGQNTFGHLVGHMISANYYLCSAISGAEMPKFNRPQDSDKKDALTAELKTSFDYCTSSLANVKDSDLSQPAKVGPPGSTRGSMLVTFAEDYGDHYAQESSYLRAAGLLPPTAQPKPGR
ncbi:MAG TPA: DinB family protein [Candidatus Acidoferrales bacterium]|nr:DinB family protein [Candidatus Acidoferrales bacterium]